MPGVRRAGRRGFAVNVAHGTFRLHSEVRETLEKFPTRSGSFRRAERVSRRWERSGTPFLLAIAELVCGSTGDPRLSRPITTLGLATARARLGLLRGLPARRSGRATGHSATAETLAVSGSSMCEGTIVLRPTAIADRIRLTPHVIHLARDDSLERRAGAAADSSADNLSGTTSHARRGVWALLDQAIVSFGNCATSVMLARGLPVAEYGVFAILLEAIQFLNSLQAALVIYPLSVRGAVLDRDALRRLCGACVVLTALLSLPLGLSILAASGMVGTVGIGVLAMFALLLGQVHETLRRAMMAHGGFRQTLPGDVVSYLGQAACIAILAFAGKLTVHSAFAAMGLTSAAAVIVQSIQTRPSFDAWRDLRGTARDFWRLGRWVMLQNFTGVGTTLACSWTLVWFHGPDAVGKYQALANLMKLSNPLTICMAGLIIPAAA